MTIAASDGLERRSAPLPVWPIIWLAALATSLVLYARPDIAPWAVKYPASAIVPIADWVSIAMTWLKVNFSWFTRGLTDIFAVPLSWAFSLFA